MTCVNSEDWTVTNKDFGSGHDGDYCQWTSPYTKLGWAIQYTQKNKDDPIPAAVKAGWKVAETSTEQDIKKLLDENADILKKVRSRIIPERSKLQHWTVETSIEYYRARERVLIDGLLDDMKVINPPLETATRIMASKKELLHVRHMLLSLINRVNERALEAQQVAGIDRKSLRNQLSMTQLAKDHASRIGDYNELLDEEIDNNKRMIEITNYEHDRYSSHKNILKIIAYCSFFVLIGIFIRGSNNDYVGWTGIPIIAIAIFVAMFFTSTRIWSNYQRDGRDWNKFK
jgi:hypothetical protein